MIPLYPTLFSASVKATAKVYKEHADFSAISLWALGYLVLLHNAIDKTCLTMQIMARIARNVSECGFRQWEDYASVAIGLNDSLRVFSR